MNSEESGIRRKNHAANNVSSCELARSLLKSMERHGMIVEDTKDSQKGDMRCLIISLFHWMVRNSQRPFCHTLWLSLQQEEQMARMRDAQLASIHDYLMNIARPLQLQGLEIHTRVIEGNDPAAQIVLQAEQDPCPLLIAMTTHGRSGVLRWLFGSVTAEVVQAAPTPLLLLRPHENSGPSSTVNAKAVLYQTVIVPLDGSSSLLRTLLQTEMEKRTRYLEQRAEPLRKQGAVAQTHVATGHPADKILRLSTQHQHSLLVMTTHGRSGLQHLFLGSVAMKVIQGAHAPVILVRGRPE